MPTRCTATTAAGRTCRAWAVRGTDPPRCAAHRDRAEGASVTEELAAQIDDLDARIARLGDYVDAHREELDLNDLCRLLDLYSKMLSRVTRMRQVQVGLEGEQSLLMEATRAVLEEIVNAKGIQQ